MIAWFFDYVEMMLEVASKNYKGIAFKASMESKEELDNEEMVVLSRNFKHFYKMVNARKREGSYPKGSELKCFKCRKPGHIKS